MTARRFELHRDTDVSGISGVGIVAEGIAFTSGVVALTWLTEWPTSVVFHERGVESVEHVHGHNGSTRIVWLDDVDTKARMMPTTSDDDDIELYVPRGDDA